ncbi:MAG: hypothetical protein R3C02_22435 [Planctomycetaceae bacterium]
MMMPLARRLLGAACALLLTATITPTADAFFYSPFGYSWGYSPYTTYYGGYGGYYGGYATGYRGYSYALYAPSYVSYGSSYCGSSCGTGCSPCGSSCGSSCNPCGVSYGGYSCGLSSCYGNWRPEFLLQWLWPDRLQWRMWPHGMRHRLELHIFG